MPPVYIINKAENYYSEDYSTLRYGFIGNLKDVI
jgi:hypothetical protein